MTKISDNCYRSYKNPHRWSVNDLRNRVRGLWKTLKDYEKESKLVREQIQLINIALVNRGYQIKVKGHR